MNWSDRIPSSTPLTFADLLGNYLLKYPRRVMTRPEFEALPKKKTHACTRPDGWPETGYLQAQEIGERHRVWLYRELVEIRFDGCEEVAEYLVMVDGDFVIELSPETF